MQKIIGFAINVVIWTLLALPLLRVDIPIPSSCIAMVIMINGIFAFSSIFIQRGFIVLYENNVFEKPKSILDYTFKYFAILSSGINYYIQVLFRRLPFIVNKLASILFLIFLFLVGLCLHLYLHTDSIRILIQHQLKKIEYLN
jgi:hypothetical protein